MTEYAPGHEAEFDPSLALGYTKGYIEERYGLAAAYTETLLEYVDLCTGYDEVPLADSLVETVEDKSKQAQLYARLAERTGHPKYVDLFAAAWAEHYIHPDEDKFLEYEEAVKPFDVVLGAAEDKSLLADNGRNASNPHIRTAVLAITARHTGSHTDLEAAVSLCATLPDSIARTPYIRGAMFSGHRPGTITMQSIWKEIRTSAEAFDDETTRRLADDSIKAIWSHEDDFEEAMSDAPPEEPTEEELERRKVMDGTQAVITLLYTRPVDEARQAIEEVDDILVQAQLWEIVFERTNDPEDFRQVLLCSLRGTTEENAIKYSVIGARVGLFEEVDALPVRNAALVEAHRAMAREDEGQRFDDLLKALQFARAGGKPVQELVEISAITGYDEYVTEAYQRVVDILKNEYSKPIEPEGYNAAGEPIHVVNGSDESKITKGITDLAAYFIRRGQTKILDDLDQEIDNVFWSGSQSEFMYGFLKGLLKGIPSKYPPEKERYHGFMSSQSMIFIARIPKQSE